MIFRFSVEIGIHRDRQDDDGGHVMDVSGTQTEIGFQPDYTGVGEEA